MEALVDHKQIDRFCNYEVKTKSRVLKEIERRSRLLENDASIRCQIGTFRFLEAHSTNKTPIIGRVIKLPTQGLSLDKGL